jgi:hypothetical protein
MCEALMRREYGEGVRVGTPYKIEKMRHFFTHRGIAKHAALLQDYDRLPPGVDL